MKRFDVRNVSEAGGVKYAKIERKDQSQQEKRKNAR